MRRPRLTPGRDDVGQVPLRHCVTGRPELRRHQDVDIVTAFGAFDPDAPVYDVLRTWIHASGQRATVLVARFNQIERI